MTHEELTCCLADKSNPIKPNQTKRSVFTRLLICTSCWFCVINLRCFIGDFFFGSFGQSIILFSGSNYFAQFFISRCILNTFFSSFSWDQCLSCDMSQDIIFSCSASWSNIFTPCWSWSKDVWQCFVWHKFRLLIQLIAVEWRTKIVILVDSSWGKFWHALSEKPVLLDLSFSQPAFDIA